jgi:hypothetical protein
MVSGISGPLFLAEKLTLHVFPIQDGIGGVLEPLEAELEVFDVIEVVLTAQIELAGTVLRALDLQA